MRKWRRRWCKGAIGFWGKACNFPIWWLMVCPVGLRSLGMKRGYFLLLPLMSGSPVNSDKECRLLTSEGLQWISEDAEQRTTSCPSIWRLPFFQSKATFLGCLEWRLHFPVFFAPTCGHMSEFWARGYEWQHSGFTFEQNLLVCKNNFLGGPWLNLSFFPHPKDYPSLNFIGRFLETQSGKGCYQASPVFYLEARVG